MEKELVNAFDVDQWPDIEHAVYHAIVERHPYDGKTPNVMLTEFEQRVAVFLGELVAKLSNSNILNEKEINKLTRNCRGN